VFLKPTANLTANHQFQMCANAMMDISGNTQQSFCVTFYTGSGTITTGPSVLQVSPPSGFTGVAINSPIEVLFSAAIDAASIAGVQLKQGGTVISTTGSLFDGDQGVELLPLTPLAPSTTYTIVVSGVVDITGNAQATFPSQSFTTGTGVDLSQPQVVSTTPANGATGVAANSTVQALFSLPVDPASFDPTNSFVLTNSSHNQVPATISFSGGYTTVTLTPNSNLTSGGATYTLFISYFAPLYDVSGNQIPPTIVFFTTQ
jgi:large repetitive protein